MTIMVRKQVEGGKQGWLYHRNSTTESWRKNFATIKGTQLSLYKDEKVSQPIEVLSLTGSTVEERGVEDGKRPGRNNRLISLQLPSPEAEELQSLLPQCGLTFRADDKLLQLAAVESSEHTQWLKQLKQATAVHQLAGNLVVEEDRILNGFRRRVGRHGHNNAHPLEPSLAVGAFLCSPSTTAGPELLPVLSRTRQALKEGMMDLGAAREEARRTQFALNSVRRQMREIESSLNHRQRPLEGGDSDAAVVHEVKDWIDKALNLMHDIDANLESLMMKDAPFAPEWVTFTTETILRLRRMEEALLLGLFAYQRQQSCRAVSEAEEENLEKLQPVLAATRSVMPYSHWRHKLAL